MSFDNNEQVDIEIFSVPEHEGILKTTPDCVELILNTKSRRMYNLQTHSCRSVMGTNSKFAAGAVFLIYNSACAAAGTGYFSYNSAGFALALIFRWR